MSLKKAYFRSLELSPFKVKEGGQLFAFPSSKQMEMFLKDVQDIKNTYARGLQLYDGDKPITDIDKAIENIYKLRASRWVRIDG